MGKGEEISMKTYEKKKEFYKVVDRILNHEEFQRRKTFKHHGNETVYDHSLRVAYYAYIWAKMLHLNAEATAVGALLHDFYTTPWMENMHKKKKLTEMHGFTHPRIAYENAFKYFPELMTPKVKDMIIKHMYPLTPFPPIYLESWLVTFADKYVSLSVFKDVKNLPKYVGISSKKKER